MHRLSFLLLAALPMFSSAPTADAASDPRITYLEQEVRDLRRQVLALTQRVDMATTRPARQSGRAPPTRPVPTADTRWVDAGKWRSLRQGMSELEVIELLGKPNSTREQDGARVIFYAMEIGDSGFLSGNVRFRDGVVAQIEVPTLQ